MTIYDYKGSNNTNDKINNTSRLLTQIKTILSNYLYHLTSPRRTKCKAYVIYQWDQCNKQYVNKKRNLNKKEEKQQEVNTLHSSYKDFFVIYKNYLITS